MDWKKTLLICFFILLAGGAITVLIFSTEPTATRGGAARETAMLVDVHEVRQDTFRPTIEAVGTVEPSQDITLSPQVGGEITSLSPNFTPGGYVQKGETLLQINPADYRNTLQQRQSDLNQALSDLNIEMGQQTVAQQDYQLLGDTTLPAEQKSLVLREPQLEAAKSRVQSARAAVEQARLDLQRTTIQAPFNAHVLTRNANVGSQVAPGEDLGRLVGLDTYWVVASIPLSKVRWLTIPDDGQSTGSEVRIRNRTAWGEGEHREGYLYKLIGALENQTRMARVLISVPDPLAYQSDEDQPPLMIGSFVEASIQANELPDVIRLDRDYVRQDETVWVMEDEELRIRDVDIIMQDARYAYITGGLDEDDRVVTTNLATVTEGAPLRLATSDETASQDTLAGGN